MSNLAQFGLSCGKEIQLKEREECYEVLNGNEFDVSPSILSYGKRYCKDRKEFEKSVTACFGTNNIKWVN
jgi:hypothetical protein